MYFIIVGILLFTGCQQSIIKKTQIFMDYRNMQGQKYVNGECSYKECSENFKKKYEELFGHQKLDFSKYSNEILKELWKVDYIISFHSIEQKYLSEVENIFENLKKRNLDREKCAMGTCAEELFGLYIKFGYFSKAKELQKKYPDIIKEDIPEVIEDTSVIKNKYKLYEVLDDGKVLKLTSIQIEKGTKIIIFANPYCEFAKKALSLILSDENLRKYFEENGLLIFPINTSISEISSISEWNKNNKLKWFVHSSRNDLSKDWENFDITQSPNFYFLKDGKIVFQINGFGPDDNEFKLKLYKALSYLL